MDGAFKEIDQNVVFIIIEERQKRGLMLNLKEVQIIMMKISESEMELLALFAAENKEGTMKNLEMAEAFISSALARDILQSIYGKLEWMTKEEYRLLWSKTRHYYIRKNCQWSEQQKDMFSMVEEEPDIRGHELMGTERFLPGVRHMVLVEILTQDSTVGHPGEHYRFFLSEEGYKNAKAHERAGEIRIYYHAAVSGGKLYLDKSRKHNERGDYT